jgi:hypothetical protein
MVIYWDFCFVGGYMIMFDNIGGKIKGLAKTVCWIGIGISVFIGFVFVLIGAESSYGSNDNVLAPLGMFIMLGGLFLSWISSFLLYGFGQLIENSDKLVELNGGSAKKGVSQHTTYPVKVKTYDNQPREKKVNELEKLRTAGLITDEEFFEKLREL